ncbi:MAG: hypothetical protein LZT29_00680 [Pantoea stewartii]|uniref:YegP family protein n=1 Tax=Pantoea stewartii TaxID=66269 RepID=UPI0006D13450|nr:YegP family protein [Pantoea stewartii]WHS97803.1 MAG: hypothetical protein LZT29_00680 [Pantoea stewartii]
MGYYVIKKSVPKNYMLDSEYYFVLKAENHKVIATSEMYSTKQAAETGIASVQANGPSKTIIDET